MRYGAWLPFAREDEEPSAHLTLYILKYILKGNGRVCLARMQQLCRLYRNDNVHLAIKTQCKELQNVIKILEAQ